MQATPSKQRDAARGNTRMRFEQWARNPVCEANTISAVRNVRMVDVAKSEGVDPSFGQSPFALVRGDQFERRLFYQDGRILREELVKKDVLPADAAGFVDFRLRMNGGARVRTLDQAIEETREFLLQIATRQQVPAVAAGTTLRIPRGVMLPEAVLIVDAIAIRADGEKPILYVGEVKTYPDRGGHTAPGELAVARAQAGIYVHGLDVVCEELGIQEDLEISRRGFLVLTRPGSNFP